MIAKLLTKLLAFILSIIGKIVGFILSPLTNLINSSLPDLHNTVTTIINFINNHILDNFTYFMSWLGPMTRGAIKLEFEIIAIFFTIYAVYLGIQITIIVITKIKSMFL